MQLIPVLILAALVFGLCFLFDKGFSKLFRGKAQHKSGLSVRANRRYGVFGVAFLLLGILALCVGVGTSLLLMVGSGAVIALGLGLSAHYLGTGIFYDEATFLYSSLGKKSVSYRYEDIREQKLYKIQGGSIVVELHMADGSAIPIQSTMDGVYPFLDTAFASWCIQTGTDPAGCPFHDPANSWWFPHEEDA